MKMKLEDVLNLGPTKNTIEIKGSDGEKKLVDVYLKPLSFALVMRSAPESDKEANMDILAERIAYSVCDEHGHQVFTKDQILGTSEKSLSADIVLSLMAVVNKVNGFSEKEKAPAGKSNPL